VQTPGKRCFPEEVGQCWRDTLDPAIGGNLNDIKEFIKAQPPSTVALSDFERLFRANIEGLKVLFSQREYTRTSRRRFAKRMSRP
jgi:hypothetical protein